MPLTEKISPFQAPNYDVFTPARRNDPRGIVLGAPLDGGHNYVPWIGLSTVRELALKHADRVGLVDVETLEATQRYADVLAEQLAEVTAERDEARAKNERISGLAADGFKVQRIVGRPKKADTDGNG